MKETLPDHVRLGAFELNLRAGELREGERLVRLQEQPYQILLMLVERAGEVVTRDEIQKKLWPNDTVVEFDHSINTAIKKLRQALSDSADEPKYVETIARRGYRLLAAVERVGSDDSTGEVSEVVGGSAVRLQLGAGLIGRTVSHYRVLEVIGGGGMGLVYKAEDLKLGRQVALKFLPGEMVWDAVALQRFEREARTASSLDHPNICTIYEVEEHEQQPFIVMQLLRGETLRDRLATVAAEQRTLALDELLDIAIEICAGLQAAHEKGVIHRDIKPANIFLTTSGQVKILDFGLAKLMVEAPSLSSAKSEEEGVRHQPRPGLEPGEEAEQGQRAETQSFHPPAVSADPTLTRFGVAMGTAGYMSPEQVRGEKLDARTDIFSFGLVLYEMATSQRAFTGETAAIVQEAIVNRRPAPPRESNPNLPLALEAVIHKALEKDREKRWHSAAQMRINLQNLTRATESARPAGKSSGVDVLAHEVRVPQWKSKWIVPPLAVLLIALIGGGLYYRSRQGTRLSEKETVVLADFANSTGDAVFDDTLKTGLAMSLAQSPFVNVLSDDKVRDTLQLMTRPASSTLTPELARELCLRARSKAYIAGSIASLGSEYVLGLKAVNCENGDVLARQQMTAVTKEKVLDALGRAAAKLRGQLGESLATVQKFDVPLADATTSSLEALKAYSLGQKVYRERGRGADLPFFERAIQLDPGFAMAYRAAAWDYRDLGEVSRSTEYYAKAFQLREHASDRERLLITADYYFWVVGELDKATQAYQELAESYPRDEGAYIGLGNAYSERGRHEEALDAYRQAVRLVPDGVHGYEDLAESLLGLQRFDEAQQVIHEEQARGQDHFVFHLVAYALAFVRADSAAMTEQERWFGAQSSYASLGLDLASDSKAYQGRVAEARALRKEAIDSAVRADQKGNAAIYLEDAAVTEAAYGNAAEAKKAAAAGLKLAPSSQGAEAEAALAFAMAGEAARPESLAIDLNNRYPLDTQLQSLWLPAIRAQLALDEKNPAAALAALQVAVPPIEFGNIVFISNVSCLYHTYVRGNTYLAAGQGAAAAAEFEKIVNHNGIVGNCSTGALARLGMARANVLESKTLSGTDANASLARALNAYKDFFALWKDADPDIPIYRQAKAEYARLL